MSAEEKVAPFPEGGPSEQIERTATTSPKTALANLKFVLILIGFGMAFVGSQVQPLLFAAIIPLVSADLGATNLLIWFFTTQLLAIGIISPFAGPLADLFGRKAITLAGISSAMLGMIITAATPNAGGYLVGQVFAGMGIAIQELMAIATIVEIVPTKYRGYYIAIVVISFLPFAPASLYGVLIAQKATWRYCACLIAVWNTVTLLLVAITYNPPPRPNGSGLSRTKKLHRIDLPGGFLMAAGLVLFLIGFNWGGQAYPWNSARVTAFLITGLVLLACFVSYEIFFAKHPMFPRRLLTPHPRTFTVLMLVILLAGVNYVSILMFWVLEAVGVYGSTKVELGIRTLPYGFCILGGAVISSIMVSLPFFRTRLRSIMTFFYVVQVIGIGCMSTLSPASLATALAPLAFALLGVGGVLIPNQLIITLISPPDLIATATCLTVSLRAVGQVIGTSVFYTQFTSVLTSKTYKDVVPAAIQAGVFDLNVLEEMMPTLVEINWGAYVQDVLGPLGVSGADAGVLHSVVVDTFKAAFDRVWFISIAFGGAAVLASLAIENLGMLVDGSVAVEYF